MSFRTFTGATINGGSGFVAVADTTAMTAGGYMAITGANATQMINIQEIKVSGQATSSVAGILLFARHSTAAVTPTALATPYSDGNLNPYAGNTSAATFTTAGTQPQRALAGARLPFALNYFGGIDRWVAAPREEYILIGQGANIEASLSGYTGSGTGAVGANIVYEPL